MCGVVNGVFILPVSDMFMPTCIFLAISNSMEWSNHRAIAEYIPYTTYLQREQKIFGVQQ